MTSISIPPSESLLTPTGMLHKDSSSSPVSVSLPTPSRSERSVNPDTSRRSGDWTGSMDTDNSPSTPGPVLPGAWLPDSVQQQQPQRADGQLQSTAHSAAQSAADCLPESMQSHVARTDQSKANQRHETGVMSSTLPSQEDDGAQPGEWSSGVGRLPGHGSESSVALLPDERIAKESLQKTGTTDHPGLGTGVAQHPIMTTTNTMSIPQTPIPPKGVPDTGPATDVASSELSRESLGQSHVPDAYGASPLFASPPFTDSPRTDRAETSMPSTEHPTGDPATFVTHTGGVGALPGSRSDSGVALPPDARNLPSAKKVLPEVPPQITSGDNGAIVESIRPDEGRSVEKSALDKDDVLSSSDAGAPFVDETTIKNVKKKEAGDGALAGHGSNDSGGEKKTLTKDVYNERDHPEDLHPKDNMDSGKGMVEHHSGSGKVTLKDKLRGEAKILVGKLSHNEDKVHEGRKMMSGST